MKKILSFLAVLVLMAAPAIAHPGGTDGKGGHTDRSTGVYHYHHGYGAHQHEDGVCPYDFDDKTGEGSGSSSAKKRTDGIKAHGSTDQGMFEKAVSVVIDCASWIAKAIKWVFVYGGTLLIPAALIVMGILCLLFKAIDWFRNR